MSSGRTTYAELKRRIERLASSLLPADNPTGSYTESEKDRIHAYIVLAHAEIEDFLERLARYVIDQARRNSSAPRCSPVISRLILYRSARSKEKIDGVTVETITSAAAYIENVVDHNNGIKSDNLYSIFMPLGMTHDDFDPLLMQNLNTFASHRGGIAHTAARLQQGSSPSREKSSVESIVTDLSHLDQKIRALR
jgi:hypothetical protein